jgi:23S rRNA (guanosine2251-2'-O)-methyltransferase
VVTSATYWRQQEKRKFLNERHIILPETGMSMTPAKKTHKKPQWVIEKEQAKKAGARETVWLFGLHAVRDALMNPKREKLRLMVTLNAQSKLEGAIAASGIEPEVCDPRRFDAPIDPGSVHQGAALEVKPLNWGALDENCIGAEVPRVLLLDRVTDPHNVGAILRSAEVLGASAVIGTRHHSAPETGALAKTASGALERQPYLRMRNLSDTIIELQSMGYLVLGLDGESEETIEQAVAGRTSDPIALVLGAEGPGLRQKTKETVDKLVKIDAAGGFGSLNVSNAAAIALYASLRG